MIKFKIEHGGIEMTVEELKEQLKIVQQLKCETQNLELKMAEKGCMKRLYDENK